MIWTHGTVLQALTFPNFVVVAPQAETNETVSRIAVKIEAIRFRVVCAIPQKYNKVWKNSIVLVCA